MSEKQLSYYIEQYRDHIRKQFYDWLEIADINSIPYNDLTEMKELYELKLKIDTRTSIKYTKIITMNKKFTRPIVHSFILNRDDNKFIKGDILYPDYHYEPLRDRHYGNIIKGDYYVNWHKPFPPENKPIDNMG